MIIKTRKTLSGTEYWDNVEKRTLFVPAGKEPSFDVTENPKSMVMGVDLASGTDKTVITGMPMASTMGVSVDGEIIDLSNMKVKELREYADSKEIEIPADIKKQKEIAQYLYDNWVPDTE